MQAGETSGPDEATKERLTANTQRLLHNMVIKRKQTEGGTSPMQCCISRSRKGSSADEESVVEAKYVAAQEEMKGKVGSTKYRIPEVIKMRMEGSPSLEKFRSIDGSKVEADRSERGLKRATGGEDKGGSTNKKRRVSKSVEGVGDLAVPKNSGVKVAKTSQSVENTGKRPPTSIAVGSAKKQPKVEMNLSPKGVKEGKVKRVGSLKHAAVDGKARKVGRPRSERYPPTKQILGEAPLGDQTW